MYKEALKFSSFIFAFALFFQSYAVVDTNFYLFLCFGQSNMAGGCKGGDATDCDTSSPGSKRVKVLAFRDCDEQSQACPNLKVKRTANKWYTGFPPYNNCNEAIGPADHFGKTMIDSIREDITIGIIPCSFSGQDIGLFLKGNTSFTAPTWAHPTVGKEVYKFIIDRCKIATQSGVLKGILFHQGENNAGEGDAWVNKVVGLVKDIKADLNLGDTIPFIGGELRYQEENGCCYQLNPYVNKLPSKIPNSAVVSAKGLKPRNPDDSYRAHFDTPSMRELGKRYAKALLSISSQDYIPRKLPPVAVQKPKAAPVMAKSIGNNAVIYSLDGRPVKEVKSNSNTGMLKTKLSGVYIVVNKANSNNAHTSVVPFIQK